MEIDPNKSVTIVTNIKKGYVISLSFVLFFGVIAVAYIFSDIVEKKQEAKSSFYKVVDITDDTDDPAIWGKNFPLQYDSDCRFFNIPLHRIL